MINFPSQQKLFKFTRLKWQATVTKELFRGAIHREYRTQALYDVLRLRVLSEVKTHQPATISVYHNQVLLTMHVKSVDTNVLEGKLWWRD
jgi:hypothetical protein